MKLAVAIPTYNEAANLEWLIGELHRAVAACAVDTTVLIIDDSSPDGTGELAQRLAQQHTTAGFSVRVLRRTVKDGFGRAYVAGFTELLSGDFSHVLQMDADRSHDPAYLPAMVAAAATSDLVVGSRYVPGGAIPEWPVTRRLLSRFGNLYTRFFLGSRIHDYTGGFNLYAADLLREIDVLTLRAGGYGFLIELKFRALRACRGVSEVPIVFVDREHGTSKMPRTTVLRNLLLVPRLRLGAGGLTPPPRPKESVALIGRSIREPLSATREAQPSPGSTSGG